LRALLPLIVISMRVEVCFENNDPLHQRADLGAARVRFVRGLQR
jgi:hypothetical protein